MKISSCQIDRLGASSIKLYNAKIKGIDLMHWIGSRMTRLGTFCVLDTVTLNYDTPYVLDLLTRDDSRTREYDATATRHCPLPGSTWMTQTRCQQIRPPPLVLMSQPQGKLKPQFPISNVSNWSATRPFLNVGEIELLSLDVGAPRF